MATETAAEQHDDGERLRDQVLNGEITLKDAYYLAGKLEGDCPCPCGLPRRVWAVASLPVAGRLDIGAPLARGQRDA